MIKAIVGVNWGDEGKGKITDTLAGEADTVNSLCICVHQEFSISTQPVFWETALPLISRS